MPCSSLWIALREKCKFKRVQIVSIFIFIIADVLILRHSTYYKFGVATVQSLKLRIKNNWNIFALSIKILVIYFLFFFSLDMRIFVSISLGSLTNRLHVVGGVGRNLVLWAGERRKQIGCTSPFLIQFTKILILPERGRLSILRATGEIVFRKFKIWLYFLKLEISTSPDT